MDPHRLLLSLRMIEKISLDYMVTGSVAAILYGKPRLTHDMDIVVAFPAPRVKRFVNAFDTEDFYCPPLETIEEEIQRGDQGHFNIIDQRTGFKIDFYPFLKDPLIAWGFEHRMQIEILPQELIWVAPPEYVILKKLSYFQEGRSQKHLEDIRAMLEISSDNINQEAINAWVKRLKLSESWGLV